MANTIQNSEMNDLVTKSELLRIMECPVCQEIPFPPIFQCTRGHNICKNCKPKLKECPTCRGLFSETRNYTVEQMVLASKHSCCYKDDGCLIELRGELMENHMNNCSYRPFKCLWFGRDKCSENLLKLTRAKDHILKDHSKNISVAGQTTIVQCHLSFRHLVGDGSLRRLKKNRIWPSSVIEFDGKVFFLHTIGMNQTFCFNVLCVGSEEDARKYRVKIICQPDMELEIQWTAPVTSIVKGAELKNPETRCNMFISSCTLDNLIQMAETDEIDLMYRFTIRYTILKTECK